MLFVDIDIPRIFQLRVSIFQSQSQSKIQFRRESDSEENLEEPVITIKRFDGRFNLFSFPFFHHFLTIRPVNREISRNEGEAPIFRRGVAGRR